MNALRSALGLTAEAVGMPSALVKTLNKGLRNETSALSLYAPRTLFNQKITGSRRFAAQDWPIERLRAIGKATSTTLNDVVLAMCSGAVRAYLLELDALPEAPLVAMVPVGLNAKQSHVASAEGGNAVGAVMCQLATDRSDPANRLRSIHSSMKDGKQALEGMTPVQILAMSAIGQAPAILTPLLRMQGLIRPPYNLIISNVPGPRTAHYWNGARMVGTYPLSIPINGMALNITCTSYDGNMAFGLWRRPRASSRSPRDGVRRLVLPQPRDLVGAGGRARRDEADGHERHGHQEGGRCPAHAGLHEHLRVLPVASSRYDVLGSRT